MKSALGFEPETKTDPSGKRVAEEWYMRATTELAMPSR
jgi:hypothetical protein